jgi:hypothetical protein
MKTKETGYVAIVLNFFRYGIKHGSRKGLTQKSMLLSTGIDATREITKA